MKKHSVTLLLLLFFLFENRGNGNAYVYNMAFQLLIRRRSNQ